MRNNPTFLLHKNTREKKLPIWWVLQFKPQKFSPIVKVQEKSMHIHHYGNTKILWKVLYVMRKNIKKRRPLPLTNISLTEKAEKNFEGMFRTSYQNLIMLNILMEQIGFFWHCRQDLFSLLTWPIINSVIRHSEVKVGKRKVKKMKRKIFRTVMKQLRTSFVKLLKFILSYEEKYIEQQT